MDPLRVAVVGSGPAGFYAAAALLAADPPAEVALLERLPTPWGLVRLGVAPDHPNIKAVTRVFEKVAQRPGFRFFGNVQIGTHLSADELEQRASDVGLLFGGFLFAVVTPMWWIAARAGLVPQPNAMVLWCIVNVIWTIGWFWRRTP